MDLSKVNKVYFIGVGGIGMSALARYFISRQAHVAGYDRVQTPLTDKLSHEGVSVVFDDQLAAIPNSFVGPETLVVYTPAVPEENDQLLFFREQGNTVFKRSEVLGLISNQHTTIGVAGTHGKTTTSSILAHLLYNSNVGCNAFLGGVLAGYDTNVLLDDKSSICVMEADEYDRSFLRLSPDFAIVTSIDVDHLDIYDDKEDLESSFREFTGLLPKSGRLVAKHGVDLGNVAATTLTYEIENTLADYYCQRIEILHGRFQFDIATPGGLIVGCEFSLGGRHNVENALAAVAVADVLGVSKFEIKSNLASFKGISRRFEVKVNLEEVTYIDDYAHHPTELAACIGSVRELYPGKKITGIFQPHLFSRTRDFMDDFAVELAKLDQLILLDIYPAREEPIEGVDSNVLLDRVPMDNKRICRYNEVLNSVDKSAQDVLLTLGAGDIAQLVEPITKKLLL